MLIRLAIVSTALWYFHSGFFAARAASAEALALARLCVNVAMVATTLIAVSVLLRPRPVTWRKIAGLLHDIVAVAVALYLGESAAAPVASIFLWIVIGAGFRFGNAFLWAGAAMSVAAFGSVYWFSDYWRAQGTLSFNLFMVLALVPPYVAALLASLNRAKARLAEQASIDPLTGLLNRRSFESGIEDTETGGGTHAMLFCDLDRFKAVNDTAGHAAGDRMLVEVARILRDSVRGDDLVARPGGDEFCIFLPECAGDTAQHIAERLRERIERYRLQWRGHEYSVGVSIGVALGSGTPNTGVLLRVADAAVYAAKNTGRGRVCVVDSSAGLVDTTSVRTNYQTDPETGRIVFGGVQPLSPPGPARSPSRCAG